MEKSWASDVMKQMNSVTHSCMNTLESLEIFASLGISIVIMRATLARGRRRSCSRRGSGALVAGGARTARAPPPTSSVARGARLRKMSAAAVAAACGGAIGAYKFGGIVGMLGTVCGAPEAAVWAPLTFMSLVADRCTRKRRVFQDALRHSPPCGAAT